jgi:hypothetical protein
MTMAGLLILSGLCFALSWWLLGRGSVSTGKWLLVCAVGSLAQFLYVVPKSPMAKEISVDKNPAAGLISAALFIAVALLLAQVIAG